MSQDSFDEVSLFTQEQYDYLIRRIKRREEKVATDRMLQFFEYDHLPINLQNVSMPFHTIAHNMCVILPSNAERTVGLRKLLEAKDCFVRAAIYKEPEK